MHCPLFPRTRQTNLASWPGLTSVYCGVSSNCWIPRQAASNDTGTNETSDAVIVSNKRRAQYRDRLSKMHARSTHRKAPRLSIDRTFILSIAKREVHFFNERHQSVLREKRETEREKEREKEAYSGRHAKARLSRALKRPATSLKLLFNSQVRKLIQLGWCWAARSSVFTFQVRR